MSDTSFSTIDSPGALGSSVVGGVDVSRFAERDSGVTPAENSGGGRYTTAYLGSGSYTTAYLGEDKGTEEKTPVIDMNQVPQRRGPGPHTL